jgi:hypothetical protein
MRNVTPDVVTAGLPSQITWLFLNSRRPLADHSAR